MGTLVGGTADRKGRPTEMPPLMPPRQSLTLHLLVTYRREVASDKGFRAVPEIGVYLGLRRASRLAGAG
jgi:hypothetical protein